VRQPSTNFAFLANHSQSLARLGALAEWAFHYDPPTTLGKLRLFAELLARQVAAHNAVEILPADSFDTVAQALELSGCDIGVPLPYWP
jgi:type I restriction enzyme, R subunit